MYKELSKLHKQSNLKMDKRLEQTLHQRGHTDGKPAHKKLLGVTSQQGGVCYSHSEGPRRTC